MKALLTLAPVATQLSTPREEAGLLVQSAAPKPPIIVELEKFLAEAKAGERAAQSAGNHDAGCFERGRQAAFTELIFMVKRSWSDKKTALSSGSRNSFGSGLF